MGIFTKESKALAASRTLTQLQADALASAEKHIAKLEQQIAKLEGDYLQLQKERDLIRRANKTLRAVLEETNREHSIERLKIDGEHRSQVARLEAELRAATSRADVAQANFEWNRLMFNKSEAERAQLTQHILQRPIPAFELDRRDISAIDRPAAPPASDGSGIAEPAGSATATAIGGLARAMGLDFEDVGDDMARALGVSNDNPDGRLEHT